MAITSQSDQTLHARPGLIAVVASALLALVAASLGTMPARADDPGGAPAPVAADPCPAPFPVDELVEGQPLTGLTVEKGTAPAPFDATVVGVLDDGIAAGLDMVLIEATSPAIDRYGIWAGMSGSPVYAADGRLVGAVAYGLAYGASPVAGVTPAAEMYRLVRAPGTVAPLEAAESVAIPFELQRALTGSGAASAPEARAGLSPLPMPVGVSGLSPQRARSLLDRTGADLDLTLAYRSGAARATPAGDGDALVPGGNAAVALAYGDTTFAATGTVTAVCADEVLMFGHPLTWGGRTSLSLHSASAVFVQEDLITAFKVANPTAILGTVEQDRLAGLLGTTTHLPSSSPVTATFTNLDTGLRLSKVSHAVDPDLTVDLAASHIYATAQRTLDAWAPGEARFNWGASGTVGGKAWSLRRHDAVASRWDVSDEMTWMIFEKLSMLTDVRNVTVSVDKVWVTGSLTEDTIRSRVAKVEVRKRGGGWADIRNTPVVKKGAPLRLRVTVSSSDGSRDVVTRTMGKARAGKARVVVQAGRVGDSWVEGSFATRLAAVRSAQSADHAYLTVTRRGHQRQGAVVFDHVVTGKVAGAVRAR